MPRSRFLLTILIFLLSASASVLTQERNGGVAGTVVDGGRNALPGARVELQPQNLSTVSDQEGRFTFTNVKPGDYTVAISYVGLLPLSKTISVHASEVVQVEAVLQVPGVQEEVVVGAGRLRGEAAALKGCGLSRRLVSSWSPMAIRVSPTPQARRPPTPTRVTR